MARTGWRLARLRVHDQASQRLLRRSPTAWLILQPGHSLSLIAVQPRADDILPTGVNGSNLGNGEAAVREQDHLRTQGHPPDRLMAEAAQFIALRLRQGHVDHPLSLRLSEAAETVPHFWLRA